LCSVKKLVRQDSTTRAVSLERKEIKTRDRSVLGNSFLSELDFLKRGCTELDLNSSDEPQKQLRERLMAVVLVGRRAQVHFLTE
jgi:hypothetical protein